MIGFSPGGRLILYSGTPIIGGADPLFEALQPVLQLNASHFSYGEIDPDVFGEELDRPGLRQRRSNRRHRPHGHKTRMSFVTPNDLSWIEAAAELQGPAFDRFQIELAKYNGRQLGRLSRRDAWREELDEYARVSAPRANISRPCGRRSVRWWRTSRAA